MANTDHKWSTSLCDDMTVINNIQPSNELNSFWVNDITNVNDAYLYYKQFLGDTCEFVLSPENGKILVRIINNDIIKKLPGYESFEANVVQIRQMINAEKSNFLDIVLCHKTLGVSYYLYGGCNEFIARYLQLPITGAELKCQLVPWALIYQNIPPAEYGDFRKMISQLTDRPWGTEPSASPYPHLHISKNRVQLNKFPYRIDVMIKSITIIAYLDITDDEIQYAIDKFGLYCSKKLNSTVTIAHMGDISTKQITLI